MSNRKHKKTTTKPQPLRQEPVETQRPNLGAQVRFGIASTASAVYTLVRKASPIFIFGLTWAALGLPAGWNVTIMAVATIGAGLEMVDPSRF